MQCDDDWYLVVWNVSKGLDGQDPDTGHPVYHFTWHEAFSACPVAAVILRLYHVLSISPALLLAHNFAFEYRFLCTTSWAELLFGGLYGLTLFRLLASLSSGLCHQGANDYLSCEAADMQYVSGQDQLAAARRQAPESAAVPLACSLEDAMTRVAVASDFRSVGDPAWWQWAESAQSSACCAAVGMNSLLLTGRKLFWAFQGLAGQSSRPRRRRQSTALLERLASPVERVEGQWCGKWPRASGHVADQIAVRCLGASVHVTPTKRRVLEMALYFERLGQRDPSACGTYFGSHWWRLQCTFDGATTVQASVLSGLAWIQPIKSNLVSCVVPEGTTYPFSVVVNGLAEDWTFAQPLHLSLCRLPSSGSPQGAAVCTEPFHNLHEGRVVPDLVEHHLRLGFHVDIYDSDGTGAQAYERFRGTGRVAYFPRFVRAQFGEGLAGVEAAFIGEPAEGCSAGMQEIHCLFRHRGRTRWVAPRLDPDEYFHSAARGTRNTSVTELLAHLEDRVRHVFVPTLEFGGPPAAAKGEHVVARFPLCSGIVVPKWMVLSDPTDAMSSHGHSVRPRPWTSDEAMHHVNGSLLRINHYLEMFGPRFVPYIHPSRQQYRVRDRSLLAQRRWEVRRRRPQAREAGVKA